MSTAPALERAAQPPLVLVVDDSPDIRLYVKKTLSNQGWRTVAVSGGADCLAQAPHLRPDCILLDVQMPDQDGFEVCRALKADPLTRDVPVVFLTASADPAAVVAGLAAGGNDYIGKPVDKDVLVARVSVALRLREAELRERRAREATEDAYQKLQAAKSDLALAHKMTGLTVMAAGLAHELNSPLSALSTNLQFIAGELEAQAPTAADIADCKEAVREGVECCTRISEIVQRMRALGDNARARSTGPVDLAARITSAAVDLTAKHGGTFTAEGPTAAVVHGVDGEIAEALRAVLENAFVAAVGKNGAAAQVHATIEVDDRVRVVIDDDGPGIPIEDLPYVFDPFFTRKTSWTSVGLGLGVALSILTRHGGRIDITGNGPLGGARATIELPRAGPSDVGVRPATLKIPTLR